ncbi:hypothetical protein [Ectobacillus ponti]|uniref:Uncharacterized protein n=1 Tax=Ectobacillus ponti TaxID=2961894 RepID=A0AA41X860_9BACI|nr:hypothetical protein [Ectobacillus ponti]MCP8968928.1 hypothetical protein [Ectobacillus ponti]
MFDPTAFENLKVVAEGAVYDHDLAGEVLVTGRKDLVDLASMSRTYRIAFQLHEQIGTEVTACLVLQTDVKSWAGEIMEEPFLTPVCLLSLEFSFPIPADWTGYEEITEILYKMWGQERMIQQVISYEYKKQAFSSRDTVTVLFPKPLTEEHAEDLPAVAEHTVQTLHALQDVLAK